MPGKVALYLEDAAPVIGTREGDTIGLEVSDAATARPSITSPAAQPSMRRWRAVARAPLVLFDGTLYSDDEMIEQGLSSQDRRAHGPYQHCGARRIAGAFRER